MSTKSGSKSRCTHAYELEDMETSDCSEISECMHFDYTTR